MSSVWKSVHAHVEHVFFYMFSLWDWTDNTIDVKWLHKQMESKWNEEGVWQPFPKVFSFSTVYSTNSWGPEFIHTAQGQKRQICLLMWCKNHSNNWKPSAPIWENTDSHVNVKTAQSGKARTVNYPCKHTHARTHTTTTTPIYLMQITLLTGWILFLLREDGGCLAATDWLVDFVTWMPPFPAFIYQTVTHKANTATIWFIWCGPLTLSPFLHRYWPFFPGIKTC